MLKALWFMVKVGLLAALAVWLAELPGEVRVQWSEYTFIIQVGAFMAITAMAMLLAIFCYNVIRTFVDFPRSWRRYVEIRRREKGYRALTLGLTAVAAGDAKSAVQHAQRAGKLMPEDKGLPVLLKAQAARLDGREEDARDHFVALLESKDAAFLGVRGLLQAALDMQHYGKALELARQALKLHPKQPWILTTVYDLEIRQRDWDSARRTLQRAEKFGAIPHERARRDRAAMLLAEADVLAKEGRYKDALKPAKAALAQDEDFAPAVLRVARLSNLAGKRKQAIAMIERAWKRSPHPEFMQVWDALAPRGNAKKAMSRMQWTEQLIKLNEENAISQIEAGRVAMEEGLWGEARSHFRRAEILEPNASLYRALATLEERSAKNEEAALQWLEKANDAAPGRAWVCMETGRIYDQWQPVALPHGAFNTIRWDFPQHAADMLAFGTPHPALSRWERVL